MNTNRMKISHQKGISLIEALVSLLVFSVGALGLAALQTTSLLSSGETKQRSLVVWKAQELADRMRSTKSADNPLGILDEYLAEIDNDDSDIGAESTASFECPVNAPAPRCASYTDSTGTRVAGTACTTDELITFDLWDVLCEPSSGLSPRVDASRDDADVGIVGVQNLEVAMTQSGNDYLLYFEWLARAADNNTDLVDATATVTTNLCGIDVELASSLDAYCVRVR